MIAGPNKGRTSPLLTIPYERAAVIHKDYCAGFLGLAPIAARWGVKEGTLRDAFIRYRLPMKRQGRPVGWVIGMKGNA